MYTVHVHVSLYRVRTLSADSTVKLEVMEKLKAEVEDNRSQMKSFLKEMEAKDRLIQSLQDRLSGKPDPKVLQYIHVHVHVLYFMCTCTCVH